MRLVTAARLPQHQVTLVTTPQHPTHRTICLEPEGVVESADFDSLVPVGYIEVRLWGDRQPIMYVPRSPLQTCIQRGRYIEQVNLYLELFQPKFQRDRDARLVSTPSQSNVARITFVGNDRMDQYAPVPGLSRNTFRLEARRSPTQRGFVHTPPQIA